MTTSLRALVGSGIKSIQRGTITISGSATTATSTISAVNMAKTVLHFLGGYHNAASGSVAAPLLILTNSTTVTAQRGSGSGSPDTTVSFQVVEYY